MNIDPTYSAQRRAGTVSGPRAFLDQQLDRTLGQRVLGEITDSARELDLKRKQLFSRIRQSLPGQSGPAAPETPKLTKGQRELEAWRQHRATQVQNQVRADQAAGARAMQRFAGTRLTPSSGSAASTIAGGIGQGWKNGIAGVVVGVGSQPLIDYLAPKGADLFVDSVARGIDATIGLKQDGKNVDYDPRTNQFYSTSIEVTGADGKPVLLDMNNPSDVQKLQAVQGKKPNFIEVTGADGKPTLLDMNNPADVERLQQIEPKGAGSAPLAPPANPPVDPRGPSAAQLLEKHGGDVKAAESEGMRIWAQKYGGKDGLASKVKPGQAGFDDIQISQGRMPSLVGQVAPQAFADNAIKNFSDTLKMDTVMPEGTTLGVADDLDEAYAKVSEPEFTEAIRKAFTSGLNLGTGSRVSTPPKRGTKPSQPFFEARTPGL